MRESSSSLDRQFDSSEFRHAYAASFMNSFVAAQIKTIREQRELTQTALAQMVGTKQAGISRLENVNYDAWKVDTLRKLAKALDVRLRISFEEFDSLFDEIERFGKASLQREDYESTKKRRALVEEPDAPSENLRMALDPSRPIPQRRRPYQRKRQRERERKMRLISVPLARAFAYLQLDEMTLGTGIYLPALMASLVKKCQFLKSPSSSKEFNLPDGVAFETGVFDGITIKKLAVFPLVIHLDADDSTDRAQTALLGLLQWAKEECGLRYSPGMITRWAYVSDVVFQTDFPLLKKVNKSLNSISSKISEIVRGNLKEELNYEPAKFWLAHDPNDRSTSIAPFTIEHRLLSLFEENIFYSEAPVPTKDHLSLLSELETAVRNEDEG